MGLDFFGVTMAASIQVFSNSEQDADLGVAGIPFSGPDGKGLSYDLWLESNSDSRVPPALRQLAYVQDMTVELGMGLNSKVQIVLAPPFNEGLVLLNSPLIQWGIGRLNISFGYNTGSGPGRESFSFGGIIQKPDVKIGNDITITLNALGIGYALKMAEGSEEESYAVDDTPATVVEKVLSKYPAISIDRIYEDFDAKDRNNKTGHAFFKPIFKQTPDGPDHRVIERGPRNDWWFIYEIVRSYGLELLIIDSEFRVKHSEKWRNAEPSKRFRLRAGVDPTPTEGKPIYPILSLSSPTESVWLASGIGRSVMKDIGEDKVRKEKTIVQEDMDKRTKDDLLKDAAKDKAKRKRKSKAERRAEEKRIEEHEIHVEEVNRVAKENSTWGTMKGNRFRAGPLSAASNAPGNPESSLFDHAKGMIKRKNHLKGIHVDVQTIGLPDMRPGHIVKIDGFAVEGQKDGVFDGLYGIIEVRHQVGLGGFMTTFKAISDFYPRQFQLAVQAAGSVPDDKEDKTPGASVPERISVEPIDSRNAANDFDAAFGDDDQF